MALIELPTGVSGADNLPNTRKALVNLFNNGQGQILQRPGIDGLSVPSVAMARASFKWNFSLYGIWGQELRKVTDVVTGATSLVGTVDGANNPITAVGFNEAVISVPDGKTYTLSKTDVLTDITPNANMQSSRYVAHIDGRFIYIPSNGDVAFFSDVGDAGSIQPLSFFDAESLPDLNQSCINFANTLYILGEDSVEKFRNTGDTPNPFTRIQGARQDFGYLGGLIEISSAFLYLGREKDQDFGFFATGPGDTVKISNQAIDKILSTYTLQELSVCVPGRFKWRGFDIATFELARNAWGFLNGNWFDLDTIDDQGFVRPWRGGFITAFEGKYYSASKEELGVFGEFNSDYGQRNQKIIDMGFKHQNNQRFSAQSLELGISQGFNAAVGTVALLMSRDNVTYGPALFRDLGALGKYSDKLVWNYSGGLGNYDGFMGLRIFTTEDVIFNVDSLYLNIR